MRVRVRVRVRIRGRVRFAFCSFGFSFTESIHAASFSMWCERKSGDAICFGSTRCGAAMELVLEQQRNCRADGGGGLEGPGWSSSEAAGERAAAGAAEARECAGVFS